MNDEPDPKALARTIATDKKCDVYRLAGPILHPQELEVFEEISSHREHDRVLLILTTWGGNPHTAYKIARFLQDCYERVTVVVPGFCKSAGTLLAIGAHEIAFGRYGELGPLDVQTARTDFFERQSGLTIYESLNHLQSAALDMYGKAFRALMDLTGSAVSVRTTTQAASRLVFGFYEPILARIDPMEIGEKGRSLRIASDYGKRLVQKSKNLRGPAALDRLTQIYPSHFFSIDKTESHELFTKVRDLSLQERSLVESLGREALIPPDQHTFECLSTRPEQEEPNGTTPEVETPAPTDGAAD